VQAVPLLLCHDIVVLHALQLGTSDEVDAKIRQLRERVKLETRLQTSLLQLQGMLEPILHNALSHTQPMQVEG
jgi:hypothetical protein